MQRQLYIGQFKTIVNIWESIRQRKVNWPNEGKTVTDSKEDLSRLRTLCEGARVHKIQ